MTLRQILALHNAQIDGINYFNAEEINIRLITINEVEACRSIIPFGNTPTRESRGMNSYIDTEFIIEKTHGRAGDIVKLGIQGGDISEYIHLYTKE